MEKKINPREKIYPIILVNTKLGLLRIVNQNSTTSFRLESHETKAELDKEFAEGWSGEAEVEMALGSGFHRVHNSNAERWELWEETK